MGGGASAPPLVLPPLIDRDEAVRAARAISGSLIGRLIAGRRRLLSIELAFLPWWVHDFAVAVSSKPPAAGRIAVETRGRGTAMVPREAAFEPAPADAKLLPVGAAPDPDAARQAVWFEALGRERRRNAIVVELGPATLVHVPYWVVYARGRTVDLIPVDAITGKVDLAIQEPLLEALLAYRAGTSQAAP